MIHTRDIRRDSLHSTKNMLESLTFIIQGDSSHHSSSVATKKQQQQSENQKNFFSSYFKRLAFVVVIVCFLLPSMAFSFSFKVFLFKCWNEIKFLFRFSSFTDPKWDCVLAFFAVEAPSLRYRLDQRPMRPKSGRNRSPISWLRNVSLSFSI